MKLFNRNFDVLERAMDLQFKRHSVLSANIANSETPNYRAREYTFADELNKIVESGKPQESLVRTDSKHMDISGSEGGHLVLDTSGAVGADGNNVDLDVTMGKLSENSRSYQNAVNLLGQELRMLKNAVRGRSG